MFEFEAKVSVAFLKFIESNFVCWPLFSSERKVSEACSVEFWTLSFGAFGALDASDYIWQLEVDNLRLSTIPPCLAGRFLS